MKLSKLLSLYAIGCLHFTITAATQTITINSDGTGKRFDGIGIVNGGGATSVLLKDYPEKQSDEIMDLVYKPMFGASVSALLVEIPGDGNSTQGSMPSHSHWRGDNNFHRGYTWWVIKEAKRRNPHLNVDATAWSAPAWVGNYWSEDMVDYYVDWVKGLDTAHGIRLDALGCHNEKGWNVDFAKSLKKSLKENGYSDVILHGFGNWGESKMDFLNAMANDPELRDALDVIDAHTFSEIPLTKEQRELAESMGKTIWNSEEHVYKKGFDMLISIVKCFNENYIVSGASHIVNWYDIAGVYPMEPYSHDPAMILAREPWSGNYEVREALWGYAHYGQFSQIGWNYIDDGCLLLEDGGSMVTMRNPVNGDYSIIIETKDAKEPQTLDIILKGDFSDEPVCVWRSDEKEQFVKENDIEPKNGQYSLTLQPNSVFSLSTTRGQQKGSFAEIPISKPFPFPYEEDFESYGKYEQWGYLPHYTADIIGCFELTDRPDGKGTCIRQTVGEHTLSWAPEWHHYTIVGDSVWHDYEVSVDVYLNPGDEAAVMGRICDVGSGYGIWAKGYYLKLDDNGRCSLVISRGKIDQKELIGDAEQQALIKNRTNVDTGGEYLLDEAIIENVGPNEWHNLRFRFEGDSIIGYIDGKDVVNANSGIYPKGMAGLMAPLQERKVSTPYFDNLKIIPLERTNDSTKLPVINPLYE